MKIYCHQDLFRLFTNIMGIRLRGDGPRSSDARLSFLCLHPREHPRHKLGAFKIKLDLMVDRVKPWIMVNGLAHGL